MTPTQPAVVFDIDGVLADVGHRLHHLARRPKDWDAFFAAAPADVVLEVGAQFAREAARTHRIVYLTGRPERCRTATQAWLDRNALPPGELLMRTANDRRPGSVVKVRELRRLSRQAPVDLFVDDDRAVVDAATAAGFAVRHANWMPAIELHDAQEREGRT
jgi:hypothetical protein